MPELLLEIGCEELPASFVQKAYQQLEKEVVSRLCDANIAIGASSSLGTPRRLIVSIKGIGPQQPDSEKIQRGPSLKAAYDADGNPSKALMGFCRSQNINPDNVYKEGDYVWVKLKIEGKPTSEILQTLLPDSIRALHFPKTMRWAHTKLRFARPLRWILASFGDGSTHQIIPFEIEGISSGGRSFGHRFIAPEKFEAHTFDELVAGLRERSVEPDADVRKKMILEGAEKVCSGNAALDEDLLDENAFLTEWPRVLEGSFKEEFLELPAPVLTTAMAKHERFFPVYDGDGKLINKFLSVYNNGEADTVREGNEWVMTAKFMDASFFYNEDNKLSLEQFLAKTEGINVHQKLGTILQKSERVSKLAKYIAEAEGSSADESKEAYQAGLYAKADLPTGLVGELASLQGIIGGIYAKRDGFSDSVCEAIRDQYSLSSVLESESRVAAYLFIAEQIDKLAGYLGVGLVPKGSSDPFGLRRAANHLILAHSCLGKHSKGYLSYFEFAFEQYNKQEIQIDSSKAKGLLSEILESRYRSMFGLNENGAATLIESKSEETGVISAETIDAVLSGLSDSDLYSPKVVMMRLICMYQASKSSDLSNFVQAATRSMNIVQSAEKKGIHIPDEIGSLDSEAGKKLKSKLENVSQLVNELEKERDAAGLLKTLVQLEEVIHDFFETTMIMVEDEKVRDARLALLKKCSDLFFKAGDFSKLNV